MKYQSNYICTKDSEIEVGKQYQYKETLPSCIWKVTVMADNSTAGEVSFNLRVDEVLQGDARDVGHIFDFSYNTKYANGAYAGMVRLYDAGEYRTAEEVRNE